MTEPTLPYRAEIEDEGCAHCGAGQIWRVVGPDGSGLGTVFESMHDALGLAESRSEGYMAGLRAALTMTPDEIKRRADEIDSLIIPF